MHVAAQQTSEQIRVRVDLSLKTPWEKVLADHKITQQDAVTALMKLAVDADPLLRSMMFGQVPERDHLELSRIILKHLITKKGKK